MVLGACKKKGPGEEDTASTQLSVQGFLPVSGTDQTEVTVTGTNFGSTANFNLITIGGYNIVPTSASATQLVFKIPTGIPLGSYDIAVKVGGVTVTASQKFQVTATSAGSGIVSTAVVPVTNAVISKSFIDWGIGGVHPRLLFSAADI
jgi:hypothetical protein